LATNRTNEHDWEFLFVLIRVIRGDEFRAPLCALCASAVRSWGSNARGKGCDEIKKSLT